MEDVTMAKGDPWKDDHGQTELSGQPFKWPFEEWFGGISPDSRYVILVQGFTIMVFVTKESQIYN